MVDLSIVMLAYQRVSWGYYGCNGNIMGYITNNKNGDL
jgi:hypothetical protein